MLPSREHRLTMQEKQALRQKLIQQRQALSTSEVQAASLAVCARLSQLPLFQHAQTIAAYMAHQNEIDPQRLITSLITQHKKIFMPAGDLSFARYDQQIPLIAN